MANVKVGIVKAVRKDKKGFQMETGEWYGKSKTDLNIEKGDEVSVTFELNENWNNIEKVDVLKKAETEKKEFTPGSLKDKNIARASALKSAVNFLKDQDTSTIESVIACARKFEAYIN